MDTSCFGFLRLYRPAITELLGTFGYTRRWRHAASNQLQSAEIRGLMQNEGDMQVLKLTDVEVMELHQSAQGVDSALVICNTTHLFQWFLTLSSMRTGCLQVPRLSMLFSGQLSYVFDISNLAVVQQLYLKVDCRSAFTNRRKAPTPTHLLRISW